MQEQSKNKQLVIIGDSSFAEIAYEYFTYDSNYKVVGFSVEKAFHTKDNLFNLPIVNFEEIELHFPNKTHELFIALTYGQLNRLRTRLYNEAKKKGYKLASYISSHAFCWKNVEIGDNVFIFEDNTIQPFVKIGNNVVLWSGNHIGHHSIIKDNCFISSHVVVCGHCEIEENCFIGVNASIANNLKVAKDNLIGLGCVINKSTEENKVYMGNPGVIVSVPAKKLMKVQGE
jgi:sugar O-acyltransferase (sialic acid O-acetyltransferase NeuD family)